MNEQTKCFSGMYSLHVFTHFLSIFSGVSDLLGRQEMYSVANEIIKLSSLPVVNTQNQVQATPFESMPFT